jgi:hypothetical protein
MTTEEMVDEAQIAWEMQWWFLAAYAAGRASVLGSAEMKTLRDAAAYRLEECERLAPYRNYAAEAAAIRAAIEGLR